MQIWNQTGFPHEFTMGMDKAGHEYIVLVVKGTFDFPAEPGGPVRKSETQVPLVMADKYTGAPGFSATLWETDFAFRKPRCDVVLNGAAYAPGGRPAERVRVGLKVGDWSKLFDVVGHREWRAIGPLFAATSPQPFLTPPDLLRRRLGRHRPARPRRPAARRLPQQPGRHRLVAAEEPAPHPRPRPAQHPGRRRGNPLALRRLHADELRPDGPRLARPHRVRRHLRPELDRQRLPLPAAPTSTTATSRWPRPTSRPTRPRGGEEVHPRQPHARGPRELPPARHRPARHPLQGPRQRLSRPPSSPTPSSSTPRTAASRWSGASRTASTAPSSTSPKPGSARRPSRCSAPAATAAPTSAPPAPPSPRTKTHDRRARHRLRSAWSPPSASTPPPPAPPCAPGSTASRRPASSAPAATGSIGAPVPLPRNWIGEKRLAHLAAAAIFEAFDAVPEARGRPPPSSSASPRRTAPAASPTDAPRLLARIAEIAELARPPPHPHRRPRPPVRPRRPRPRPQAARRRARRAM